MNTQKQIIVIVALLFLVVGACSGYALIDLPYRTDLQANYQHDESVERGALLFANNCRTCHGNTGEGFVGPRINRDDWKDQTPINLSANRHLIERTLMCGRAGTLMPAWLKDNGGSLNERQIEHLVDFLTAPLEEGVVDAQGNPTNHGWLDALQFAHNLNEAVTLIVSGDTLQTIAASHRIGVQQLADANNVAAGAVEDALPNGSEVTIPPVGKMPGGATFKVEGNNVSIRKIAERTFFGAALLADHNNLNYQLNLKDQFTLLDDQGNPLPGLLTGETLALPEGSVYVVNSGDTIQAVADLHGITTDALVAANPDTLQNVPLDQDLAPADAEGKIPTVILNLPQVDNYTVRGQTFDDIAKGYGNVTGQSLADKNGLDPSTVLRVGQEMTLPEDSYGTAPPDAINSGMACVQYAVPNNIFDQITGGGPINGGGEPFTGTIVAKNTTFLQTDITLPPSTEVTITFDNQDANTLHNVQFFDSPTPGQGDFLTGCTDGCAPDANGEVRTEIAPGPVQHTFTFTTPASTGTYSFDCAVHPQQMQGKLTIQEGAPVPGS